MKDLHKLDICSSRTGREEGLHQMCAPSASTSPSEKRQKKQYAWMDSGDEGPMSSDVSASPEPAPPAARNVETLSQMLRLAESLRSRGTGEFPPHELVDICAAAARVKFYDPALFTDTLGPALEQSLRSGLSTESSNKRLTIGNVVEVLGALASLNAASALSDVFMAAAKALKERGDNIDMVQLKFLKDIYSSTGKEKDLGFLLSLSPAAGGAAPEVRGSSREGTTTDGLPMRPGARICESYLKTGHCRAGASCRWDHPEDLRVKFNSEGYPMRPWAPACPYYMAMGTCDYRKTCKWHHPDKRERKAQGMNYAWIPKGGMG